MHRLLPLLFLPLLCLCPACPHTLQSPTPAALMPLAPPPILLIRNPLPPEMQYEVLEVIVVRNIDSGAADGVLDRLAEAARQVGANAVMDVAIGLDPSGGGGATAHGKGIAIRLLQPPPEDMAKLPNFRSEWR